MTKDLQRVIYLEENPELHLARLIILFMAMSKKPYGKTIVGITKIAKLDFLLRYPTALEKALEVKGKSVKSIQIQDHERTNVESKMVRFKFGPWDYRYWSFLSILKSKDLIKIEKNETGITVFSLTKSGISLAENLEKSVEFNQYKTRSTIIATEFGQLQGSHLMKKIYTLRPELYNMRYGEIIEQ